MLLATNADEVGRALFEIRRAGQRLGLVPTMGALHEGHRSLMRAARETNDFVAISIFVNPLQFNETADLDRYPRDLDRDLAVAQSTGVDLVFAPSVEELYPGGDPVVSVDPGTMALGLEGASRPGHFVGVATVVAKLFALLRPERAYFGEKDFEQLALIRRLVLDLSFPLEVIGCPTVRDADGLALSSRNARLSPNERAVAPLLYAALCDGATALDVDGGVEAAVLEMRRVVSLEPLIDLEYAAIRDEETMKPPGPNAQALRLLIAARLGTVRLIDNLGVSRKVVVNELNAGAVT